MSKIKTILLFVLLWILIVGGAFSSSTSAAQKNASVDLQQMKRDLEIIESVLNTVKQQFIAQVARTRTRSPRETYTLLNLADTARKTEGVYLDGYGALLEVYLPNITESARFSVVQGRPTTAAPPAPSTSVEVRTGSAAAQVDAAKKAPKRAETTVQANEAKLNQLSDLIVKYQEEAQRAGREAALQSLWQSLMKQMKAVEGALSGLQVSGLPTVFAFSTQEEDPEVERERSEQMKSLRENFIRAIADYASVIGQLQNDDVITLLLKSSPQRDFGLFGSDMRTVEQIRFSVKDLKDYKAGKLTFTDLRNRVVHQTY